MGNDIMGACLSLTGAFSILVVTAYVVDERLLGIPCRSRPRGTRHAA